MPAPPGRSPWGPSLISDTNVSRRWTGPPRATEREAGAVLHQWEIEEREYLRQEERRGRRHGFEHLDPRRTALLVVDLVAFFIDENDYARGIIPNVNSL